MGSPRVKLKLASRAPLVLVLSAIGVFLAAVLGGIPGSVADAYARNIFPRISSGLAPIGGLIAVSWIDILIPLLLLTGVFLIYLRRPMALAGLLGAGYLFFFFSWGVNYQRSPLETRLDYRVDAVTDAAVRALVDEAAASLNAMYADRPASTMSPAELERVADQRVRQVVRAIDGVPVTAWGVPPVKRSRLLDPFFRAGSVDGMFNPFWHEAIVTSSVLWFERPATLMHELAHLRGYAREGEANFIALLAGIGADHPELRYSGWQLLWMYVATPENNRLLDAGPRRDLDAIRRRIQQAEVEWVNRTQRRTFDTFLRANRVPEGVRSYAEIVRLAAGTRHAWDRFGD